MKTQRSAQVALGLSIILLFGVLNISTLIPDVSAQQIQADSTSIAAKAPRLILIIRHAEKPPESEHSPHITETGQLRARKLATLFAFSPDHPARLPRPEHLFATASSEKSSRPSETIAPLSAALQKKVNTDFANKEIAALAQEILSGKYAGKVVLICWHHGTIPNLAAALGVTDPPKWKDETFDQIWEIDWNGGKAAHLTTAPQMLLPGDSIQ